MIDKDLIGAAEQVRKMAYAPYSTFAVGAALLGRGGEVFVGCNVENISFGLTMCAERVALGAAIAAGVRQFGCIAIVSDSREPVVPCGACRQALAEFASDLRIVSSSVFGVSSEFSLAALLPIPRQGILS